MLVDSTRSGKQLPDALSKTVPIWCTVINRALSMNTRHSLEVVSWDSELHTPSGSVSENERSHITRLLDSWAEQLTVTIPLLEGYVRASDGQC